MWSLFLPFLRFHQRETNRGIKYVSLFLPFLRFLKGESKRGIRNNFFVLVIFKVPPKRI
jgi:hypothetical protein